jgi:hypothetical protein
MSEYGILFLKGEATPYVCGAAQCTVVRYGAQGPGNIDMGCCGQTSKRALTLRKIKPAGVIMKGCISPCVP